MSLKVRQLHELCTDYECVPCNGTGPGGKVTARDYETALGQHYINSRGYTTTQLRHLKMRLACEPMKAYRYDKLPISTQNEVWNSRDWIAEQKYNGWRILFTFIPGEGLMAWGGNLSTVDFLPIDYTEHILLAGIPVKEINLPEAGGYVPAIIDTEALCFDTVTTRQGLPSSNTLEAVGAILGSAKDVAVTIQNDCGASLSFAAFDFVAFCDGKPSDTYGLLVRQRGALVMQLAINAEVKRKHSWELPSSKLPFIPVARGYNDKKKTLLHTVWRAGGEGIVLKHVSADYVPGGRLRTHQIKVKRTMSGEIGDDIDAFVVRAYDTAEWSAKGLIGGIDLGVYVDSEVHIIASVTSMPDEWRKRLTAEREVATRFCATEPPGYENKVLVVDGQELSGRNRKLMHARVDWRRGFRTDKTAKECTFEFDEDREVKF